MFLSFIFFCFSLLKTTEIGKFVLGLPKWEFSTGKSISCREKSRKMTLPPLKNIWKIFLLRLWVDRWYQGAATYSTLVVHAGRWHIDKHDKLCVMVLDHMIQDHNLGGNSHWSTVSHPQARNISQEFTSGNFWHCVWRAYQIKRSSTHFVQESMSRCGSLCYFLYRFGCLYLLQLVLHDRIPWPHFPGPLWIHCWQDCN